MTRFDLFPGRNWLHKVWHWNSPNEQVTSWLDYVWDYSIVWMGITNIFAAVQCVRTRDTRLWFITRSLTQHIMAYQLKWVDFFLADPYVREVRLPSEEFHDVAMLCCVHTTLFRGLTSLLHKVVASSQRYRNVVVMFYVTLYFTLY